MSAAQEVAARLRVVWISHPHADHHLGITRILAECRRLRGALFRPIVVVAPVAVLLYLKEYAAVDPSVRGTYVAVSTTSLEPSAVVGGPAPGGGEGEGSSYHLDDNAAIEKSYSPGRGSNSWYGSDLTHLGVDLPRARAVWESLGVLDITNTRVMHCSQAYGVRVTLSSNSSGGDAGEGNEGKDEAPRCAPTATVVYSGDTRPCDALVALGRGATLLIHEATFGDDKQEEAVNKRHSTIGEALGVATRMGAYRTVLTHFSQRYPRTPPIEGTGTGAAPPILAFDFMHLAFRDLLWAPVVTSSLSVAFPAEEEEEDDEEERKEPPMAAEGEGKGQGGSVVNMTLPGAFATHPLCKGKGPCNCFEFPDFNEEEGEGGVMRASDKARRKRKAALIERDRQRSRGSKL